MSILAECDICGNQHRVGDDLAGRLIRCSDCGVKIHVPTDQFITADAFIDEGGRLRRREPEHKPSIWTWIVAIVVACLVMFVLAATIWALLEILQIHPVKFANK